MMTSEPAKSTADLVTELSKEVSRLVRDELRLAALEMRDKGKQMGMGAGLLGGAGVLAWYGGAAVFAAVVLLLALVWPAWVAALVTGVVLLLLATAVAAIGRRRVSEGVPPVPQEAVRNVKQDVEVVKEGIRDERAPGGQ